MSQIYFVGASTHPAAGVPTALVSTRLTAVRLMEKIGIRKGEKMAV